MERSLFQSQQIQKLLSSHNSSPDLSILLSNFRFFSNLKSLYRNSSIIDQLSSHLTLQTVDSNTQIYPVNSPANSFFFILEGQVTIHQSVRIQSSLIPFTSKKMIAQFLHLPKLKRVSNVSSIKEIWSLTNESFVLGAFESFGEEILNEGFFRQHSVVAKDRTVLMCLDYDDYTRVVKDVKKAEKTEVKSFLKGLEIFAGWTQKSLEKVLKYFKVQECAKNQILYKQGDVVDFVYFIKKGEFLIAQNVKIPEEHKVEVQESGSGSLLRLGNMKSKTNEKNVQILIRGENEALGIEEVINSQEFREFTCSCLTDLASVVKISNEVFSARVLNPDTVDSLKKTFESTAEWIQSRIKAVTNIERAKDTLEVPLNTETKQPKTKRKHRSIHCIRKSDEDPNKNYLGRTQLKIHPNSFIKKTKTKNPDQLQTWHKYKLKKNPPPNFLITFREKSTQKRLPTSSSPKNLFTLPY